MQMKGEEFSTILAVTPLHHHVLPDEELHDACREGHRCTTRQTSVPEPTDTGT